VVEIRLPIENERKISTQRDWWFPSEGSADPPVTLPDNGRLHAIISPALFQALLVERSYWSSGEASWREVSGKRREQGPNCKGRPIRSKR